MRLNRDAKDKVRFVSHVNMIVAIGASPTISELDLSNENGG